MAREAEAGTAALGFGGLLLVRLAYVGSGGLRLICRGENKRCAKFPGDRKKVRKRLTLQIRRGSDRGLFNMNDKIELLKSKLSSTLQSAAQTSRWGARNRAGERESGRAKKRCSWIAGPGSRFDGQCA